MEYILVMVPSRAMSLYRSPRRPKYYKQSEYHTPIVGTVIALSYSSISYTLAHSFSDRGPYR